MPLWAHWIGGAGGASAPTYSSTTTSSSPTLTANGFWGAQNATASATTWSSNSNLFSVYAGTAASASTVWYCQEDQLLHAQYLALAQQRAVYCRERTEAEKLADVERQRVAVERHRIERERRDAALTRSKELLLANLTPEQQRTFEQNKWFVVEGGLTKQRYRIRSNSYAGNIDVLQDERVSHRLCVHCVDGVVPLYDHLLAQKLHLEFDEVSILKIANRQAA